MLIESILDGAVAIFHGDQEAVTDGDCNGVRRCAPRRLLRQLLHRKIASRYGTFTADGFQGPLRKSMGRFLMMIHHAKFSVKTDVAFMINIV